MSKPIYRISPALGVGRLGNSPDEFYLAPTTVGGMPTECDAQGNPAQAPGGGPQPVAHFKDAQGRVKRQAARFCLVRQDVSADGTVTTREIGLDDPNIKRVSWTVHVANKKAAWYNYSPLRGNLMFGAGNSYANQAIPLRNADTPADQRQQLIIDPGPRTLTEPGSRAHFNHEGQGYRFVSFPTQHPQQGLPIKTLGEMRLDAHGNLLVLGGLGSAGGETSIQSFAGADTWNDDISDGQVTAHLSFNDGTPDAELTAWVLIGSPKFAPELVNISTLADVMADTAVRYLGAQPAIYDEQQGGWQEAYQVNYDLDIRPFLQRFADYQWVGNMQPMNYFVNPPFDPRDASAATHADRQQFFSYFRQPGQAMQYVPAVPAPTPLPSTGNPNLANKPAYAGGQDNQLFSGQADDQLTPAPDSQQKYGLPLMPLNSGSNSVSDSLIDKFATLTPLQYFLLKQWANGHSSPHAPGFALPGVLPADWAGAGNCVGEPMCPGIETTWNARNPSIYSAPLTIKTAHDATYYAAHGLDWGRDETEGGGCEPGDLTKRMAVPWQSDFFQCSVQFINFTDPSLNKTVVEGIPAPPTYYAYWWPPQSPWNVLTGVMTSEEQRAAGVPAGLQVLFSRGINAFDQMVMYWHYLGFVINQNNDATYGRLYPYFVEKERNHDEFHAATVAVGTAANFVAPDNVNFQPVWYLRDQPERVEQHGDKQRRVYSADVSRLQRNARLLE